MYSRPIVSVDQHKSLVSHIEISFFVTGVPYRSCKFRIFIYVSLVRYLLFNYIFLYSYEFM